MAPDEPLISLADYERAAAAILDPGALAYIERFADESPLPVIVKGVLTARDAELAAAGVPRAANADRSLIAPAAWRRR